MNTNIFKLNSNSSGHVHLVSEALPRGYFEEYFNGKPLPSSWAPPPFEIKRVKAKLPDILAWKEYLPLLSVEAVKLFEEIAPGCAEYMECLTIKGNPYYVINVLATEDILDVENSEVSLTTDGNIRLVRRFVFNNHVPGPLFKLSNLLGGPIFITRCLAKEILAAGLLGFEFRDPAVNETALLFHGINVGVRPN